uniref:Pre-mRNA-splicing factor SPF27 n=1 Tax=Oryzias latipes TaxID=8090 RepID=A0A3P9KBC2_ORYLA
MAGTASVAGEVFVDALPYFDQGYDAPGVREAAAALVEEETRRYRPTKNYLSYLPMPEFSPFETEIMRNEFERLAARQPMDLLSMKRYELPAPTSGQKNDITAWQECVNNSMAQLEHQAIRIENLELMSHYGTNAWKVYNDNLAFMIELAQKELHKFRKKIQDLNWQRKNDQLAAGAKLRELESKIPASKSPQCGCQLEFYSSPVEPSSFAKPRFYLQPRHKPLSSPAAHQATPTFLEGK